MDRYFDDFTVGGALTGQRIRMTEEEILSFARRFDPHPFHLDPGATSACGISSPGFEELK